MEEGEEEAVVEEAVEEPPMEGAEDDVDEVIEEAEPIAVELSNAPAAQELRDRFDIDGMVEVQEDEAPGEVPPEEAPGPFVEPEVVQPSPPPDTGFITVLLKAGYRFLLSATEATVEERGVKVLQGIEQRAVNDPFYEVAMQGMATKHQERLAPIATPEAILAAVTVNAATGAYMHNTRNIRKRPREAVVLGEEPDPKRQRLRDSTEEDLEAEVV